MPVLSDKPPFRQDELQSAEDDPSAVDRGARHEKGPLRQTWRPFDNQKKTRTAQGALLNILVVLMRLATGFGMMLGAAATLAGTRAGT